MIKSDSVDQIRLMRMFIPVVLIFFLLGNVTCVRVKFHYTTSDVTDDQMPDVINVTFKTETQFETQLHLKRAPDFNLDAPMYTLNTDQEGNIVKKKVKSDKIQGVSFYQDVQNKAVFKVYKCEEKTANKKSKFQLKGEFHLEKSKYLFNSENKTTKSSSKNASSATSTAPSSEKDDVYFLKKLDAPSFDIFDASEPPPPKKNTRMKNTPRLEKRLPKAFGHLNFTSFNWSEPLDREKRATLTDYYIDVAAIVDYKLYSRFLTEANHSSDTTLRNIREHYAFVFTGIDMLYQGISNADYRINVRLCKVYVTETRSASAFIEDHAVSYGVGATTARSALERFVYGNGNSIVGNYDHAMLFTGYDLYFIDNNYRIDHSVVGIAYIGTMCRTDGTSITVIEDRSDYSTIDTAAHEMGHSLSAQHDGLNNRCAFSDRYIMAASNSRETDSTKFHPWQFSPCSIDYFSGFLSRTVYSSRGYDCLGFILNVDDDLPDVSNRLLGQEVTPDQQCKQLHGSSSYYCRGITGVTVTDICHAMYCQDPLDYRMCIREAALVGTSCGDGKICVNGQCVSDPYAPQLNEGCMFGDQPGIVLGSYTCSSYVKYNKGICYDDNNVCCSSCGQIYHTRLGCEYGDSATDCKPSDCTTRPKECCHTCQLGIPFTTTITTRRSTPARTPRAPITTRGTTSATTPRAPITPITTRRTTAASTSSPDCHLGDNDLQPEKCTSSHVCKTERNLCCEYCRRVSLYNSAVTLDVILPNLWAFCFIAFVVFKKN